MSKPKLFRITTAPVSMSIILRGQLKFMSQHFNVVGLTKKDNKHFQTIQEREGVRLIPLDLKRTISPLKDLLALIRLIRILIMEKPEIVHTHTPKAGLIGMLASWVTRVPIRIHTVGGMPLMGLSGIKSKIVTFTEKLTYSCAHQVWPNSNGLMNWIENEGLCLPSKMKVIGKGASNGVNTKLFDRTHEDLTNVRHELRKEMGIGLEDIVFIFVGRIAKEKGMNELREAFTSLVEKNSNVHLLLIGLFEDEHGGMSTKEREQLLKTKNVHWPGRSDDVRPYFAMSDIFLLPSYREGFPNALMEAGSMGLPAIATDINGCNEIIQHQENGFLVPVKDVKSLKEAMTHLIENPTTTKEMGQKSRKLIENYFDNSILWKSMLSEYQSAINAITKT